jgi:hypothetical protein
MSWGYQLAVIEPAQADIGQQYFLGELGEADFTSDSNITIIIYVHSPTAL